MVQIKRETHLCFSVIPRKDKMRQNSLCTSLISFLSRGCICFLSWHTFLNFSHIHTSFAFDFAFPASFHSFGFVFSAWPSSPLLFFFFSSTYLCLFFCLCHVKIDHHDRWENGHWTCWDHSMQQSKIHTPKFNSEFIL